MYQNYITGQTTLSLNLDFSIPANHIASVIIEFVDSIPKEVIEDSILSSMTVDTNVEVKLVDDQLDGEVYQLNI